MSAAAAPAVDTEHWVGAEYTPARASNQLWWWQFDAYEEDVTRELSAARRHLGYTAVRMFLHSTLYDADAAGLHRNMSRFLDIAGNRFQRQKPLVDEV